MTGDARRTEAQVAVAALSGSHAVVESALPPWAGALIGAPDLLSLALELTQRVPAAFGFRDAALLLQDPEGEIARLLGDEFGGTALPRELHLVDSVVGLSPHTALLRRPWVGRYAAVDHGLLLPGATGVERIAILPLGRAGRVSGLLCLGCGAPSAVDAASLEPLAALAALSLEATFNRLRLARGGFDDPLTGWHRERYLWVRLREELARSARGGDPVALIALDVRDFHALNAALGRGAGDRVLRELTARIDAVVRDGDATVRLVGDRFMLLLPGTGPDGAARVVSRVKAAVDESGFDVGEGRSVPVRVAIGSASGTASRGTDLKAAAEALFAEAMVALARAKSS